LFAAFKDAVELAVLGACAYAFHRRLVQKPARLEPNREGLLILALITAIMLTDILFDGFRFALLADSHPAIAHERDFAFIGGAVAAALAGAGDGALVAGHHLFYWAQMLLVFSFLVLLPTGEHFHIVTALPALYFRRGGPTHAVPKVDLERLMAEGEGAEEVRVGVRTARDLVWKDALDAFTCTECGRCKDACPTFLTGKPLALKWVFDGLKHHLLDQRAAIVGASDGAVAAGAGTASGADGSGAAGGGASAPKPAAQGGDAEAIEALPPLVGAVISEDTLWACTTCGYCEAACPIELEHLGRFYRMRQHRVMMDGEFPHELRPVFDAYEVQSNPWGLPADTRGDWARDLGVPLVSTPEEVKALDYLFYVGSAQSFDPRGQKIARAFVAILKQAGVRFGILGPRESSTGECVRRAGNEMLFQQLAGTLVQTLSGLGVTRIVTCDPHAFNSLKNEYPEFGGRYEVVHHTRLIAELLASGRIAVDRAVGRVVYHDPCYLGRHNGEYTAPREVLRRVAAEAPLEFPLHAQKAMCCGAGGARMWMEETIGKRINVTRAEQALALAPSVVATACPYCAVMMSDGLRALDGGADVQVRDLAELVAEAMHRGEATHRAPPTGVAPPPVAGPSAAAG
jgi:Fe-S oxidoreductase